MNNTIPKKLYLVGFLFLLLANEMKAQVGQWVWVNGDSIANTHGIYGIKGVASPLNKPGSRREAATCTDTNGNLWLFGGLGRGIIGGSILASWLNDLWKYDVSSNQWTWVSGSNTVGDTAKYGIKTFPDTSNKPGSRWGSSAWADNFGNIWIFGGYGYTANGMFGDVNELWRYNTNTNEWTWMKGAAIFSDGGYYGSKYLSSPLNCPRSREHPVTWTDKTGRFWLYGGSSTIYLQKLNDLWRFEPSINEWTWMDGDSVSGKPIIYGVLNVQSPTNQPGARSFFNGWSDNTNSLWLFGGGAYDGISGPSLSLNDLWKYNISDTQWTWKKGDDTFNTNGFYQSKGMFSDSAKPGARRYFATWTDLAGNLWLYGGSGYAASGNTEKALTDIWKYNPSLNQWNWISGDSLGSLFINHGVANIPSPDNSPGARATSAQWTDIFGNFWLFGGNSLDANGNQGEFNDLWKYQPDTTTTLPLHLLTFTAKRANTSNLLNWTTAQEVNTNRFEIERSSNCREFSKIGVVKANSNTGHYNYTDNNPTTTPNTKPQTIFYRLKMLDKDGKFTYSPIRQINIDHSTLNIAIFPNPAKDNLQLQLESDKQKTINLQVVSQDGKVVLSKDVIVQQGVSLQNMNINKLAVGHYFLKVIGETIVLKFEKAP